MKVLAIGFHLSRSDKELIRRMMDNVLQCPEAEIIDLESFTFESISKENVLIIYGKRATKLLNGLLRKSFATVSFPEPMLLRDLPENSLNREKAKKDLLSLKEKLINPSRTPGPSRVTIVLSNGQRIIAGESPGTDMNLSELQDFLQLLDHPAFKEVTLDFEQDDSCLGSGGDIKNSSTNSSDSD